MKQPMKMKAVLGQSGAETVRKLPVAWSGGTKFSVPMPPDEKQRLRDLHRYEVLDTAPEASFDHLAQLAAHICQAPIALISLVDSDRQWFKARVGVSVSEMARDIAFCAHAIMQRGLFEIPDALQDERFAGNPLVVSDPRIRFYAGETLVTPDNHAIGTLCVIDRVPRKLTPEQAAALRVLAEQVMAQFELRRQILETKSALQNSRQEIKKLRNRISLLESARRE
jgi:GAF domain-containing protein